MSTTSDINFEKVLPLLLKDEDYKQGDAFQALLNLGYAEWQKEENNRWGYQDMLDFVEEEYGRGVRFAILVGKANQQIENGGFYQYFDNGYASGDGGCFAQHDPGIPLHKELVSFLEEYDLDKTKIGKEVTRIFSKLHISIDEDDEVEEEYDCDACGGSGFDESTNDTCEECGGKGFFRERGQNANRGEVHNTDYLNALDSEYYKYSSEWVERLDKFFRMWVDSQIRPSVKQAS